MKNSQGTRKQKSIDNDLGQAIIRPVVFILIGLYVLALSYGGVIERQFAVQLGVIWAVVFPITLGLVAWTYLSPGELWSRRVAGMAINYCGMAWMLAEGGRPMLPAFALILWVTAGNGIRFGRVVLLYSTAAAVAVLLLASIANEYWRTDPFLTATLFLTVVVVPSYIFVLLRRIQAAYDAAREADRMKSLLLAQASHDLRQPIHAISLFIACLRDLGLEPAASQLVDNIDRSLLSVSRLFKSLLDISTLDSGRVKPNPETVPIADIIEDVIRQNADGAAQAGTRLTAVNCAAHVVVDRALLTTMLQNIVNNAVKYAAGRAILVGCRRRRGMLSVEVYDTGPGIAPEHRAKVFEEFYQVRSHGDRDIEGVGLGLAIVRRLADVLELRVELTAEVGRGTRLTIAGLPIAAKPRAEEAGGLHRMPHDNVGGLRVLLVEDDRAVLEATATLLRRWGCRVQAETGVPARIEGCDLIVTDFDLGNGVTGNACIAAVRATAGRDLPAVVLTGHDRGRVQALCGAGVPVLAKPVQPAELRSILLGIQREGSKPQAMP